LRFAVTLLASCLLAAPAAAFTPERAGIMVDAVRANDCRMSGAEAPDALQPLGLESVEVQTFVDVLFTAGLVTLSEDMEDLILAEPLCLAESDASMALIVAAFEGQEAELQPWAPDFDPARGAELIAIIRGNDCEMTDAQAGDILPDQGFGPGITRDIVTLLMETGMASVSADGSAVGLSPALCAADPADDAAVLTDALSAWNETNSEAGGDQ